MAKVEDLRIETLVQTAYQSNCYVVISAGVGAVIDPGEEDSRLRDLLGGVKMAYVINTHAHPDHVGGDAWLAQEYGVPVLCHDADRALLEGWLPKLETTPLEDGQVLTIGHLRLRVMHTPGHSPGHVVLIGPEAEVIFTGDLVFAGSVGRTDLPGGSPQQMEASLRKLLQLPGDYTLYPGHGPVTTLSHERWTNPFLIGL